MAKLLTKRFWVSQACMLLFVSFWLWNNSDAHRRMQAWDWFFPVFMGSIPLLGLLERRFVGDLPEEIRTELRHRRFKRLLLPLLGYLVLSVALIIVRPSPDSNSNWFFYLSVAFWVFIVIYDLPITREYIRLLREHGASLARIQILFGFWLCVPLAMGVVNHFQERDFSASHQAHELRMKAESGDPNAIASLQHECDAGNASGCFNLAFLYDLGLGKVQKDFGKAAPLYEKGCAGGSGHSCQDLAEYYMDGRKIGRDYAHAYALLATCHEKGDRGECLAPVVEFLTGACGPDSPDRCPMLAWIYRTGKGIPANEAKAAAIRAPTFERYEQECKNGKAKGCEGLSALYKFDGAVPADPSMAAEYQRLACQAGEKSDCPPPAPAESRKPKAES